MKLIVPSRVLLLTFTMASLGMSSSLARAQASSPPDPNPGLPVPIKPVSDPVIDDLESAIVADPPVIDLGVFSTTETAEAPLSLRNSGTVPVTIRSARGDCGCTTTDFARNTVLGPGESTTVTVRLRGGPAAKVLRKAVTFTLDGYLPLRVPVQGESVNYVKMIPARVGHERHPDGRIVLESIDGQPFRVAKVTPPILVSTPVEARSRHELIIDWDRWKEVAVNGKLTFTIAGHPLCTSFFTNVDMTREDRTRIHRRKIQQSRGVTSDEDKTKPTVTPPTDLFTLVRQGRRSQVSRLVKDGGIDLEKRDASGMTPLCLAAKSGQLEIVQLLLDAGAAIDGSDRVQRTPLMHAATARRVDIMQLLVDRGADVNARDIAIGGPLAWACGFGDAAGVRILLDAGAHLETRATANGYTPLIWAAGFGDHESIPLLLEAGADIEARDTVEGATALMHAARTGDLEGMKALIAAGADVQVTDRQLKTPLIVAAAHRTGTVEKIRLLLDSGAVVTHANAAGLTALEAARSRRDARAAAIVQLLQERMTPTPVQDE